MTPVPRPLVVVAPRRLNMGAPSKFQMGLYTDSRPLTREFFGAAKNFRAVNFGRRCRRGRVIVGTGGPDALRPGTAGVLAGPRVARSPPAFAAAALPDDAGEDAGGPR